MLHNCYTEILNDTINFIIQLDEVYIYHFLPDYFHWPATFKYILCLLKINYKFTGLSKSTLKTQLRRDP